MRFATGEAMGMNMVTIATDRIVTEVTKHFGIRCAAVSGNACVDKKPAWRNFLSGRGMKVQAEVVLNKEIVKAVLKTTPEKIVEVVTRKSWLGSMVSGAMGYNAHFANMVAALYLAMGQDIAHVVEGSLGITTAEVVNDDLYFSVWLPSVMVGVVGGGTHLPTQHAALSILGLSSALDGDKKKFAAVVVGTVLCGELSLTAALATEDLAKAHQKLGRGGK
jgi:hydroxymethylglutaryl-CoA reductase (NADPH)